MTIVDSNKFDWESGNQVFDDFIEGFAAGSELGWPPGFIPSSFRIQNETRGTVVTYDGSARPDDVFTFFGTWQGDPIRITIFND